jgi:5-methylcytosine-specific restriction endonuclease McrA
MAWNKKRSDKEKLAQVYDEARRQREQREQGYRDQALKLYPHVCARCGREFEGKKLRELTVHHRDHDHDNNPPDGSNWELLCIYCHDNEHSRHLDQQWQSGPDRGGESKPIGTDRPFANLDALLKNKK